MSLPELNLEDTLLHEYRDSIPEALEKLVALNEGLHASLEELDKERSDIEAVEREIKNSYWEAYHEVLNQYPELQLFDLAPLTRWDVQGDRLEDIHRRMYEGVDRLSRTKLWSAVSHGAGSRTRLKLLTGSAATYDAIASKSVKLGNSPGLLASLVTVGLTTEWLSVLPVYWLLSANFTDMQTILSKPSNIPQFKKLGKNLTQSVLENPAMAADLEGLDIAKLKGYYARTKNLKVSIALEKGKIPVDLYQDIRKQWIVKWKREREASPPMIPVDDAVTLAELAHAHSLTAEDAVSRWERIFSAGVEKDQAALLISDEEMYGPDGWDNTEVFRLMAGKDSVNYYRWAWFQGPEFLKEQVAKLPIVELAAKTSQAEKIKESLPGYGWSNPEKLNISDHDLIALRGKLRELEAEIAKLSEGLPEEFTNWNLIAKFLEDPMANDNMYGSRYDSEAESSRYGRMLIGSLGGYPWEGNRSRRRW